MHTDWSSRLQEALWGPGVRKVPRVLQALVVLYHPVVPDLPFGHQHHQYHSFPGPQRHLADPGVLAHLHFPWALRYLEHLEHLWTHWIRESLSVLVTCWCFESTRKIVKCNHQWHNQPFYLLWPLLDVICDLLENLRRDAFETQPATGWRVKLKWLTHFDASVSSVRSSF